MTVHTGLCFKFSTLSYKNLTFKKLFFQYIKNLELNFLTFWPIKLYFIDNYKKKITKKIENGKYL